MNDELGIIDSLGELEAFMLMVENGGFGLQGVEGIGLAKNNSDGRPFIAVFDSEHKLLLGRWVTQEVYDNGKELVRNGPKRPH